MIRRIVAFFIFFLLVVSILGGALSPQDQVRSVDAIVAISGDQGHRYSQALDLYNQGLADTIIFSGAARDPASPSNAEVMRKQAIAAGVPSSAILVDEDSYSTRENARNVARIVVDKNFNDIILVTSPYHQRRAALEFDWVLENYEVEVLNYPATSDDSWQRSLWWISPRGWYYTLSESAKVSLTLMQRLVGATGEPIS